MDIRKHIIILCLLCCHALGVMADGQIVYKYVPISEMAAESYFTIYDPGVTVTGVSYGDYQAFGRIWVAYPTASKKRCCALKVQSTGPFNFSFDIIEHVRSQDISQKPTYEHTLIVDGQAKVQTKMKNNSLSENISFNLSAGEHEIVIMSNFVGGSESSSRNITIRNMRLHAHSFFGRRVRRFRPYCGSNGYIKRRCVSRSCSYIEVDTLPMPAPEHKMVTKIDQTASCMYPGIVYEQCTICNVTFCGGKQRQVWAHNFQNGRCVNNGCGIKLPVKNAAGVYQVGDAYELRGLAEQMQSESIPQTCNIDLTADIIYPNDLEHIPIGNSHFPFSGTFDGHGHRIVNMHTPSAKEGIGLFGYVKGTPRRPAIIANVIIDSSSTLKGHNRVGAIAGMADFCDIMRCVSWATVRGSSRVGGIVGDTRRECHLIDCAALGTIHNEWKNAGGLLSGTLRKGYIMDSYASGSLANMDTEPALAPTTDSPLRHCFQIDAKAPMTGVASFSSAQLSDGTLTRMLCEKNGKDMPAHWQQGTTEGCPMPIFVPLTDRPASDIQPQSAKAKMSAPSMASYSDGDNDDDDDEWYFFSPDLDQEEELTVEDFVFYDEADSTLNDFSCYVTTTFRNVPTMPMFAAMQGGDASECNVIYCKNDSTVIMEYNYMMDGKRYSLTDATKQYTTPDSVVHLERYTVEGDEGDGEFLMTSNVTFRPDNSGYEEKVSYGVSTRVSDWEVSQTEGMEPSLNYYLYDEDGQQRVEVYSLPLLEDEDDDFQLPVDMDYTLDENGRLKDIHYVRTDPLTGEKYNIGGQYYIYDEQGEQVQMVSYEPVEPLSNEMRQTEYCTIRIYNADDTPAAIIPIEHLQPDTLDSSPTRTSGHVYDIHGNLVRLTNDADALKSLPKGIYITRGRKILVH